MSKRKMNIMKAVSNIKQDQISEVAIKRFSYYGINKTTLTEIAENACTWSLIFISILSPGKRGKN